MDWSLTCGRTEIKLIPVVVSGKRHEPRVPCPFRKFHPAWIGIVGQNHRMMGADACNPALAREGKTVTRAVQCAAAYSGAEDENRTAGRIGDEPTCWSQ